MIALSRGEEPSAQRRALEADPMAAYVPPGGRLVETDSQNEGSLLGKPVLARTTRIFEIAAGSAERALEDARAAATSAGWEVEAPSTASPDVLVAEKRVPSGGIALAVTVFRDAKILPDGVRPPALQVNLRHNGR